MENENANRSQLWFNIREVLAKLDLKENQNDGLDRNSAATEIEGLVKNSCLDGVSNRLSEMEEAGKEATSLIAHLKDQHGFNEEEQASQDKIMEVFEYEGRW